MATTIPQISQKVLMEGGGLYSEHNPYSFTIVDRVAPILCKAAASAQSLEDNNVFTYCDFGTADGGMGGALARIVVDRVKSLNNAKPIRIVFEDQAENDFSPIMTKHQHSISRGYEDVFVSVVGRSFYKQCLPAESVDVSFISAATDWPDLETDAECEPPPPFQLLGTGLKWKKESKSSDDWERFLIHRARELKKNGQLVVVHFLFPSDLNGTSPCDKAFKVQADALTCFYEVYEELQKEGRLKRDENFCFPCKFRTKEELEAPFLEDSSPVRKAGLSLCSVEKVVTPCPITTSFHDGKLTKEEYGRALALFQRSWSESLVADSLKCERTKEEKKELVEEIYSRLAKCIPAKASNVGFPFPLAILVAKRV